MEIRYINKNDDKNAISRIYEESWKTAYKGIVPQDYLDSIPEGRWVNNLEKPGWNTLVCLENGSYIGTSSFCKSRFKEYPEEGEIISIYFLPEYWGKGYGRKLFEAVLNELKKQGFKTVYLWVLEDNKRARRFYESLGLKCTTDYRIDNIAGRNLKEVRYTFVFEEILIYSESLKESLFEFTDVCFRELGKAFEPNGRHSFYNNISGNFDCFWCLLSEGKVTGTVAVKRIDDSTAELKALYLLSGFRGKGYGYKLLDRAVCFSKEKGYKRVVLDSVSAYSDALKLYEQYGFKHIARYNENNYADVFMEYRF
ncbi:MAG: GNAT family N-acetyltransferase [Lachnospiraceae bacterium]|nr:GNAT family N-acetyltransferase [Lachnospiraceae bacterium]